jgi:formylglycine-generating enzyme required for sulfatase activity
MRRIITLLAAVAAASGTPRAADIPLVTIHAGRFLMGSPASEPSRNEDERQHEVTIVRAFLLGQHEVTQQEWRAVLGTTPSVFADCGPTCPVDNVSAADIDRFLAALNRASAASPPAARLHYRLPTEAEWEYACRAGTTTPFSTGPNLTTAQANYNGSYPYASFPKGVDRQGPTPAGTFPPNAWGLADMHGNVWEWTSDWYAPYGTADPHGPNDASRGRTFTSGEHVPGRKRVIRGGSWFFDANSARCALRYTHAPADRGFSLGFRVAADRAQ